MSNILRIRRRAAGGASGAPGSLYNAELAFNEQDNTLYYGYGISSGTLAAQVIAIGGPGSFVDRSTAQDIDGIKTFKKDIKLNGSTSGDITLKASAVSGSTIITLPATSGTIVTTGDSGTVTDTMLSVSGVTAGVYGSSTAIPVLTINNKGRVTSASTTSITVGDGTLTINTSGTGLSGTGTFTANATSNNTITITSNATDVNTASTIVARNASKRFNISGVIFEGSTSGTTTLVPSAIAGSTTITLPATSGNLITTGDAATVSNSMLTNSKVTVGTTDISLGASSTVLAGLTSVTSTSFTGELTGNSSSATKLKTARNIAISGDATGNTDFDGTAGITISLTLANTITAGTYTKVTVDSKGRATAGTTLSASDIPTLTASKVSDFDAQVRTSRLDQLAVPTAAIAMNSQRITGLAEPVNAQDAATKNYVDSAIQGLDPKQSVKAASTSNITSLSGTMTIDGVALVAGDRVLVKDQSTASLNGIYVVAASAWSRASDADTWGELPGAYVFIEQGTQNAEMGYLCTVDQGGTLGTTSVTWVQFNGAGQVVAGAGLTKTGNQIDVVGTTDRVIINSDSIDIAPTYVGQTSITTLGTIGTGTWSATAIAVNKGGTNLTSYAIGDMIYADGTTSLAKLNKGTANQIMVMNSGATAPSWTSSLDGITIDCGTF